MSGLRDRLTRVAVFLFAAAVVAIGAGVAGDTTGAAASAAAKPKWLLIPGFWPSGAGPEVVGSASGRGWIVFSKGDGRSTLLGSLRSVAGRLSFARSVLPSSRGPMMIVGSQLLHHLADASGGGPPGELRTAPLLANGSVGTPRAVPDDPEKTPPENYRPLAFTATQVGDRIVWLLQGENMLTEKIDLKYWACCSSAGELSDVTRFLRRVRVVPGYDAPQLGVDSKGRLWLAWRESSRGFKLLELDPETLVPRTPAPATLAGAALGGVQRAELSCAAFCRVVMSALSAVRGVPSLDILVSSPGRASPVRMVSGTRTSPANLLAVSDRSGSLLVASEATLHFNRPPWNAEEISVVRGDARGSHARRLRGSAVLAPFAATSPFQWQPPVEATFVPGGLVFFAKYYNFREETQTRFLAGFLPLTR